MIFLPDATAFRAVSESLSEQTWASILVLGGLLVVVQTALDTGGEAGQEAVDVVGRTGAAGSTLAPPADRTRFTRR
jgi:hypothetical protein